MSFRIILFVFLISLIIAGVVTWTVPVFKFLYRKYKNTYEQIDEKLNKRDKKSENEE